jgi:hypothetical protein
VRRSPTFAAVVILALTGLEIALVVASLLGWDDLDLTRADYLLSACSIPLGLASGVGLLRRRLWGWAIGVGDVAFGLVTEVVHFPFADDPWPLAIAASGTSLLLEGAILALLNGRGVRDGVSPRPPDTGFLGDLPVEPCVAAGLLMIVGGLALEVGWGWMILALWMAIVAARRLRRRAGSTI